jgi:two-component system nitrogen regulation response regulator GlnG
MQRVFRAISKLCTSRVTVLLTGEPGTGKERVARALHDHSPRCGKPFVACNTAAIPAELLEAELFGCEKGAVPGAQTRREGRFEQADGGTIFLDEIGDMSMQTQARLLRAFAEGEYYSVGGQRPVLADVRVIAATQHDLSERVKQGLFRSDLYHRLNVVRIELPPLRARTADIPELLSHSLKRAARELQIDPKILSRDAEETLLAYQWPGNVRELVNLCMRLSVLVPGTEIQLDDLPPETRPEIGASCAATYESDWVSALANWADGYARSAKTPLLDEALPKFERVLIRAALKRMQGHRREASLLLGWGRNTLTQKMKQLGME